MSVSRSADGGIHALHSSKPIPRCTAVRAEGGGLLTEEFDMKAHWAGYFELVEEYSIPLVPLNYLFYTCADGDSEEIQ